MITKVVDMQPNTKYPTAFPSYRYRAYRTKENTIEIVRKEAKECNPEKLVFTIHPISAGYIKENGEIEELTTETIIRFFENYRPAFIETGAPWFPRLYTSEAKLKALMDVLNNKVYKYLVEQGYIIIDRRRGHCIETFECWPAICEELNASAETS